MEVHDMLGIEPTREVALKMMQFTWDGVSSFLETVFKPGLEELGFLVKDKVRFWRLNNIMRMLEKAKGLMNFDGQDLNLCANPRVGLAIMEGCSEVDDDELQELWAGLFVSSCTPDGRDDSNLNFVDLIRHMSSVEARIIEYACKNSQKVICPNKLIVAKELIVSFDDLSKIAGTDDIYRLDSELDHMRSIELLASGVFFSGGFSSDDELLDANISPSALALNLYFKTHSTGKSPIEFWGESLVSTEVAHE
jgi:hypothetical protein